MKHMEKEKKKDDGKMDVVEDTTKQHPKDTEGFTTNPNTDVTALMKGGNNEKDEDVEDKEPSDVAVGGSTSFSSFDMFSDSPSNPTLPPTSLLSTTTTLPSSHNPGDTAALADNWDDDEGYFF